MIDGVQVVSFDIFDTLVKRSCAYPTQVFDFVEEKFNENLKSGKLQNFKNIRIKAEAEARGVHPDTEITLDEIYENIDLSSDETEALKDLEIRYELKFCVPNIPMAGIFDYGREKGKRVIIVSDMYLPKCVIEEILKNCRFSDYDKLYLSSDIGVQKKTGALYDHVLKELGVSPKDILHVGDRKITDFLIPVKKGMRAYHIDTYMSNMEFADSNDLRKTKDVLFPFINNQLPAYESENEVFRWGYEAFGPLLLGFCDWVHEKVKERQIDKLFFLARDMNLVIDIYRKKYGNDGVEFHYLEVSRRSLRTAFVLKNNDLSAVYDTMTRKKYTVEEVLNSMGLTWDDIAEKIKSINNTIGPNSYANTMQVTPDWFGDLNDVVLEILKSREDYTAEYLHQFGFFDDCSKAIVDIGWHSTIQNMMEKICGEGLVGLYFGNCKRVYFDKMETYGYWYDLDDEYEALDYLAMVNILEAMLFAKVGTTLGYEKNSGEVRPIYNECEMDDFSLINDFQRGAMTFVDDYIAFFGKRALIREEAVMGYSRMAFSPSYRQASTFSGLPYEEHDIKYMAKLRKKGEYILSPKKLLKDYSNAKWKEAFIKQLFPHIKDPYKLDMFIKRMNYKRKRDVQKAQLYNR